MGTSTADIVKKARIEGTVIEADEAVKDAGFQPGQEPFSQIVNGLHSSAWQMLRGLQSSFYNIIVGSSSEVTYKSAHCIIDNLSPSDKDKISLLDGTHQLNANLAIAVSVWLMMQSRNAVINMNGKTLTLSGNFTRGMIKVSNAADNSIIISGNNVELFVESDNNNAVSFTGTGFVVHNGIMNASGMNVGGSPVGSSTDTFWSDLGGGDIGYSGGNVTIGKKLTAVEQAEFQDGIDLKNKHLIKSQTILNQSAKAGVGLYFDGSTSYVQVSDDTTYAGLFPGSIIAHIKPDSDGENDLGRIFQKGNTGLDLTGDTGSIMSMALIIDFSGTDGVFTASGINTKKWNKITVSYDASDVGNVPTIYINGEAKTVTVQTTPVGTYVPDTGNVMYIGDISSHTRSFDGSMTGVIFLNYELTAAQHKAFSSSPLTQLDWADYGGSNVAQNVSSCVNSGTTPYDTFSGASATGFTAVKTTTGADVQSAGTADEISFISGKKYFVSFTLTLNSGVAPVYNINQSLNGTKISDANNVLAANGENSYTFTANATTTGVVQFFNATGDQTNYAVSNLSITKLGATAIYLAEDSDIDPDTGYAITLRDSSGNENHGACTAVERFGGALIDREQKGTFTPAFSFSSSNGDLSHVTQTGYYTIQNSRCYFELYIAATQTTASGDVTITGMPAKAKSNSNRNTSLSIVPGRIGAANKTISAQMLNNTTTIRLVYINEDAANTFAVIDESYCGSPFIAYISGSYPIEE